VGFDMQFHCEYRRNENEGSSLPKEQVFAVASRISGAAGFACWIAFALIGSTVDSQGVLHEPFGLIPIGWLLLLLGVLVIVLRILWVGLRALWQAKR